MKLDFFSDTHKKHHKLTFNGGEILFFCGDLSSRGNLTDIKKFAEFVSKLPYLYKVIIAGNHDFCFENELKEEAEKIFLDHGLIYLNDQSISLLGLNIHGSPITPWFHDWAFNRLRGEVIKRHWEMIPDQTDVLITHGPPYGILDQCYHGERVGCVDLLDRVLKVKPTIHAFGHIHEQYGVIEQDGVKFINACNLNESYQVVNPVVEILI